MNRNTALTVCLTLAACDLGRTKLGDLPEETASGGAQCADGEDWTVFDAIVDGEDATTADAVLILDDGLLLGGTPASGVVQRLEDNAGPGWSLSLGRGGLLFVKALAQTASGDFIAVAQGNSSVRSFGITAAGELAWETDLGPAHFMAWMQIDIEPHPEGGNIVAWHSGNQQHVARLARLGDDGTIAWTSEHALAPGTDIAINWARGAMDLLPDGDILHLTAAQQGLRLIRTDASGELVSDNAINVQAWPQDLEITPEGRIFVVTLDESDDGTMLEVDAEGQILETFAYTAGQNSALSVAEFNPANGLLYLGGESRGPGGGTIQEWTLVVDGSGAEVFNFLQPGFGSQPLRAVATDDGGFVVSRHNGNVDLERVTPCE